MIGRHLQGFCARLLYYHSELALGIASSLEEPLQLPETCDKIFEWDKKFTSVVCLVKHPQKKYLHVPGGLSKTSYINWCLLEWNALVNWNKEYLNQIKKITGILGKLCHWSSSSIFWKSLMDFDVSNCYLGYLSP